MRLVIAEKPSVAQSIAAVLGAKSRHDGYLEGSGYIVSWCFGHLAELADAAVYNADDAKWTLAALPIIPISFRFIVRSESRSSLTFCGSWCAGRMWQRWSTPATLGARVS